MECPIRSFEAEQELSQAQHWILQHCTPRGILKATPHKSLNTYLCEKAGEQVQVQNAVSISVVLDLWGRAQIDNAAQVQVQ